MKADKEITTAELYEALEVANKRIGAGNVSLINDRDGSGEVSLRVFVDAGRIFTPSEAFTLSRNILKAANEAASFPYNGFKIVKRRIRTGGK